MVFIPKMLCGIIGWPLGHTLSPLMHNQAFADFKLPGCYFAWPTPPDRLPDFVRAMRTLRLHGVSVTIPHKETVRPYLDHISDNATLAGAVNTLFWDGDRLCGDNTDIEGFMAPLLERKFSSALILGAGGASSAAAAGLKLLGVPDILITNRNRLRAELSASTCGLGVIDWADRGRAGTELIVNATPLGLKGELQSATPFDVAWFTGRETVYDLVYTPCRTRLLAEAEGAGCKVVYGLPMLVIQGQAQFRRWTGLEFDADRIMALLGEA